MENTVLCQIIFLDFLLSVLMRPWFQFWG